MRVLVTGSSGFVGSRLVATLEKKCEVVGVDPRWGPHTHRQGIASKECDEGEEFDVVFHGGGMVDVATCEKDPLAAWEANVVESVRLAKLIKSKFFVFISTVATLKPVNTYGHTKAETFWLLSRMQLPLATVILPNIYGLGGSGVVSKFLFTKEPVIYGSGEQRRDFAYIDDVLNFLIDIGLNSKTGLHPFSGERITVNRLAYLCGRTRLPHTPPREFEIEDAPFPTAKRLHHTLLKDGIKDMVKQAKTQGMEVYGRM